MQRNLTEDRSGRRIRGNPLRSGPLRSAPLRPGPGFTHVAEVDEGVVLLGEEDWRLIPDGPAALVLKRLGRGRTELEVVRDLRHRLDPAVAHYSIMVLRDAGLLASEDPRRGRGRPIGSRGFEPEVVEIEGSAIWRGTSWVEGSDAPRVVIVTDYLHPVLWKADGPLRRANSHVLLIRATRDGFWVGPLLGVSGTASGAGGSSASGGSGRFVCLSCLARRIRANLPHLWLRHRGARSVGLGEGEESTRAPGVRDAVIELLGRIRAPSPSVLGDRFGRTIEEVRWNDGMSFDLVSRHRVLPWPDCRTCSEKDYRDRTVEDLVSPVTGIVGSVDRVPVRGIRDAHVYTASHAVCLGAPTPATLLSQQRDPSGGKGFSDEQARRSALLEALERSSALFRGDEPGGAPRSVHPYVDVRHRALDPRRLLNFSEAQYAHREEHNARASGVFNRVPRPLDPERCVGWTEAHPVTGGERRLVPTSYVHLGYDGPGSEFFPGDSNGLAAGESIDDAVVRGFLELVERDAVACWWYNRTRQPRVEVTAFEDPLLDRVLEDYDGIGRDVWVLDITHDMAIPCLAAVSRRRDGPREDIIFGFGAHLDASRALRSAIAELNQLLPSVQRSPSERRTQLLPEFAEALEWWETATVEAHRYLEPDPMLPPVGPGDFEPVAVGDPAANLETCVRLARPRSLDIYYVDHTRRDIGVPVAKVIVLDLRSFWRRLGPGRLYEVPVELGRISTPRTEDQLNPVSLFV